MEVLKLVFEISAVISGIGAGVTFSVTSYWKKKDQKFKWGKFLTTVGVGAIAGVAMGLFDLPVSSAYEYMLALGAVPLVENGLKIVSRKVIGFKW